MDKNKLQADITKLAGTDIRLRPIYDGTLVAAYRVEPAYKGWEYNDVILSRYALLEDNLKQYVKSRPMAFNKLRTGTYVIEVVKDEN